MPFGRTDMRSSRGSARACLRQWLPDQQLPLDKAEALAERLSFGTWTHTIIRICDDAEGTWLPDEHRNANDILELMKTLSVTRARRRHRREIYPNTPLERGPNRRF